MKANYNQLTTCQSFLFFLDITMSVRIFIQNFFHALSTECAIIVLLYLFLNRLNTVSQTRLLSRS